jgi:serine/threonine protein kinase
MSLYKENREELQKRQDGLENAVMMMAVEGITIPEELASELKQVQGLLSEFAEPAPFVRTWTSWLGHTVEGFRLSERMSSGSHSHLFRAVHETTGEECAIKLASTDAAITVDSSNYFCKQAVSFHMELCQYLSISANTALNLECQRLEKDTTGFFVKVLSSGITNNCFYYRMPLLQGQSLKELISLPDMPFLQYLIELFDRLCSMLDHLSSAGSVNYHGNLQADSIFVSKTDIVLLSPGSFDVSDSSYPDTTFMLSTPAYYPFFDKSDLFALGLIFWEAVCKRHPLAVLDLPERPNLFAAELRQMLEYRKSLNHAPLWQFLKLILPRDIRSDISDEAELIMVKALRLSFQSDGCITADPGFINSSEFAQALNSFGKRGILRHT